MLPLKYIHYWAMRTGLCREISDSPALQSSCNRAERVFRTRAEYVVVPSAETTEL